MLVLAAPDEGRFVGLLKRLDAAIFRADLDELALPLEGRKLHVHIDWAGPGEESAP